MTTPDPFAPPPVEPAPGAPTPPLTTPPMTPTTPAPPQTASPALRIDSSGSPQLALIGGVILVVIGTMFLVGRVLDITLGAHAWPLWIIVPGLAMLTGSLFIPSRGGVGLAIPGAIVTMAGLVLWVQESYGLYETWAYAWALVAPTGPGLGMLVYGLARGDRELVGDGLRLTLIGLGLFLGFALFFEGAIGLSGERLAGLDEALPFVVIGLGGLMVVLSLIRGRPGRRA